MFNSLWFFVAAIVTFTLVALISRKFGKEGLYAWIGMAVVVANLFVCKCVDVMGFSTTLGQILFGTVFLATDILTERFGKQAAKKAVWVGVSVNVAATILMQIALRFHPNDLDMVQDSMQNLFGLYPRVALASCSMFIFSNQLDIFLFSKLRKKTNGKFMWLRNNTATIISQCVENFFFYLIAFGGIYPFMSLLSMTGVACVMEIIVSLLDTPFLYLAVAKLKKVSIEE